MDSFDNPLEAGLVEGRMTRELLDRIIESSADGILAFDRRCRYTVWNPAMERISGRKRDECIGRVAFDVFPFLLQVGADEHFYAALEGKTVVAPDLEYVIPETDRRGYFEGVYSPLVDDQGAVVGGLALIRDVTERRRLEESKRRFISDAAHELRSPLAVLSGYAEVLVTRRTDLPESTVAQALQSIATQTRRMQTLIGNLLDFSRLERSTELDCRPVALSKAVRGVLELNPAPGDVAVSLDIDDGVVVLSEPVRFEQMVSNLLTNAYKYGGDKVEITARSSGPTTVELAIADNGEGVPPGEVDNIFEPFSRGTQTRGVEGSGLGLAIVRSIAEACGGRVGYDGSNGGARFFVEMSVPTA